MISSTESTWLLAGLPPSWRTDLAAALRLRLLGSAAPMLRSCWAMAAASSASPDRLRARARRDASALDLGLSRAEPLLAIIGFSVPTSAPAAPPALAADAGARLGGVGLALLARLRREAIDTTPAKPGPKATSSSLSLRPRAADAGALPDMKRREAARSFPTAVLGTSSSSSASDTTAAFMARWLWKSAVSSRLALADSISAWLLRVLRAPGQSPKTAQQMQRSPRSPAQV
mmetsp:Transcript_18876/g.71950  ORF Transcript_18876/g.71950 Transcript_18876/m.71950 type:complete len:231 (+) Transcript_18876:421-1113(+)